MMILVHQNFYILYKDNEQKKIDVKKTLHSIDGETLLKMAIDLGVETPDFIPSIPVFKNELKSDFETASQTFEKAYKNVEEDPSLAIGLANSALESIIKEILSDNRVNIQHNEKDTLSKLISTICKAFRLNVDSSCPTEIRTTLPSDVSELASRASMELGRTQGVSNELWRLYTRPKDRKRRTDYGWTFNVWQRIASP